MKKIVLVIFLCVATLQIFAQTYTSQNNRTQLWTDNVTWGTTPPSTSIAGTVNVYGNVSLTGNLSVSTSGGATLNIYDTLNITGSFTNNGVFNLPAGGILNAASFDNTSAGAATASIGGKLNISGTFSNSNDFTILAGSVVTVDGDYTNTGAGAAALDVYGTLIIKGNLTTSSSIRVRPGGLLIVIGNVTGTNAGATAIINEGNTVAVGEFSMAGDVTTSDQFYIFDDTPTFDWGATIDGTNWNGGNGGALTSEFPTESSIPSWLSDILAGLGVSCAGANSVSSAQTICNNSVPTALTGTALTGVIYLWESSTTSATAGFSTALGTSNAQNYSPGSLTQTTWYRRRITKASPSCSHYSTAIQITVFNGSVWTGASGNAFNTGGNWCGGAPTSSVNALIPSGKSNYPTSGSGSVLDLIIQSGASVSIANSAALNIYGNLTNSGTLSFSSATGGDISFLGSTTQTVTGGPYTFSNMTVNSGNNQVVFSTNVTVNRVFNFTSGIINMSGTTLTLGTASNNVTNAGTQNYIAGRIANGTYTRYVTNGAQTTFRFPMGTTSYNRPFYFTTTANITTGGTMSVTHTGTATTTTVNITDGGTIQRRQDSNWTVTTGGGLAGGTFNIFAGGTGFGTVGNLNNLRLMRAAAVIPTSTHVNATGSFTDFTAQRNGVTLANLTGGALYIGSVDPVVTPLPIKLISFNGYPQTEGIMLKWVTSKEDNFDYFLLERAGTDLNFQPIATINGKGGIDITASYDHVDAAPLYGKNYYRLKSVDLDLTFEYSDVILAQWNFETQKSDVSVYPNPIVNDSFTLEINHEISSNLNIRLLDSMGKEIIQQVISSNKEVITLTDDLKPGVYFIKVIDSNFSKTIKVIIQ